MLFIVVEMLHHDMAYDDVIGQSVPVPGCHGFLAGIVCSAASGLDANRQKNKTCVQAGTRGMGRTAQGVIKHVARHRSEFVVLEMVTFLDSRGEEQDILNLDDLRHECE